MISSPRPAVALLLALAGVTAHAPSAAAQRLSLRPQIGFYIPTNDLIGVSQGGDIGKIEAGPSFGAAVGVRFGSRFGVEVTGTYVPTTFSLGPAGAINEQEARLFLGNALAVFHVLPATLPISFSVNGGIGMISRGGVAFTNDAKTSDVAGVLGAAAGIRLGGIALVAGADLFTYSTSYSGTQQTAPSVNQLDIQLRLGFGLPLGGQ
jgi:hypothetical protein